MTIDDYMHLAYRMEIVKDQEEGGYVVSIPELLGCVSIGETLQSAVSNIEDAKRAWFSAAMEDGYPIPLPNEKEAYSGQFKLRLPKSLHKELAERSKREGTSMNQYCLYLLSRNAGKTQDSVR